MRTPMKSPRTDICKPEDREAVLTERRGGWPKLSNSSWHYEKIGAPSSRFVRGRVPRTPRAAKLCCLIPE
jgi:hypothetical protein